ncbi:hypothetical protein BH23CHL8_BH23CHL8_28830 [soil metagenome]
MGRHARTQSILKAAIEVIGSASMAMTVRQVFYQLVSRQVVENSRSRYQAVSDLLVAARREGIIAWTAIEDRLRRPRHVAMWHDLGSFIGAVRRSYRRDVWADQPRRVEVWLEKDALSGIFEDVLAPYGVTLNVGRGYDGWSSVHAAAERLDDDDVVLYFGDFDASGEDMVRSLRERLADQGAEPTIIKCALTFEDISRYRLPPDFAKASDTRAAAFTARYGERSSVELDALPVDVLVARLQTSVEDHLDMGALARTRADEERDQARLLAILEATS